MQFHIKPFNPALRQLLQQRMDRKTKPLGSLGRLEALAIQVGLIQNTPQPQLHKPAIVIFAGDHGLAHAGVSPFPQAVTAQMVMNFLAGGAAISVLAKTFGLSLTVVDAGVNADLPDHPLLLKKSLGRGTANSLEQPAMSLASAEAGIQAGASVVTELAAQGCNLLCPGEMGIANTSAAALILARLTHRDIASCTGRGTGLDTVGLARKTECLAAVLERHRDVQQPLEVLATFGGFEIAMLVGAYLAAAQQQMVIMVDGFIATAALLVAHKLYPQVLDYCVFSHASDEKGHRLMLDHLQAEPLLHLGLRLGEGSGAATAYPLVQAAVALLNDMASFEEAGVSEQNA